MEGQVTIKTITLKATQELYEGLSAIKSNPYTDYLSFKEEISKYINDNKDLLQTELGSVVDISKIAVGQERWL